MKVIGLTGGIASGKTTVADMLAAKGAAVIDTDVLARDIVRPGEPAYQDIVAAFGDGILLADRTLDRAALGAVVFADPVARGRLNAFTHPRIRERMLGDLAALAASLTPPKLAVLVVPLLFENGLDALVEESWLVALPVEKQRRRLIERDGFTPEEADRRINSQMPLDEKRKRATRVIANDGDLADLQREVDRVWEKSL